MADTHLHLIVNHFPVIGMWIAVLSLIGIRYYPKEPAQRMVMGLIIGVSLFIFPTYLTGEDIFGRVPPEYRGAAVQAHVAWALRSTGAVIVTLILAILTLVDSIKNKKTRSPLMLLLFLATLISACLLTWTAYFGGSMGHPEIH